MNKKYLAIDIGGSSMKYGLIDEEYNILEKGKTEISRDTLENFRNDILNVYKKYENAVGGIAVSHAGTVDRYDSRVVNGGVFSFLQGSYYKDLLKDYTDKPLTVVNDAVAAGLAELECGVLKGIKNATVITLGSAIGVCLICEGKILKGEHYYAGQVSLIKPDGNDMNLGNMWSVISGADGLSNEVQKELNTEEKLNGYQVFEMANAGDERVLKALDSFCTKTAIQLYNLQTIFDNEVIVIGGGISAQPLLIETLNRKMKEMIPEAYRPYMPFVIPEIIACKYHNDANLIGALVNFKEIEKGL